jgi:glyoxylase-like metal-dependent hydrolase (beta-lactamase superfamily II)
MIVVNEHDVLVVDSHITADAGRALLATVRGLTDKPVRFLVNSHYHFDHAHGNQAFLSDEILIIGHEFSRTKLLEDVLSQGTYLTIGSPESQQGLLAAAQAQLAEAKEESRSELEAQIAMIERHISALDEVVPTPPDTTLVDKLTLHRGGREIQLLHLGRGHTGGDVVVYLPAEKVVFTGDLFYDGAPYLGDGYANEMPDTLERLAGIDWEVVVPGHGPLVRERSKIEFAQQYLRTYWDQVEAFHSQGLTPDQAMAQLDMTGYEAYSAFQQGMPAVRLLEIARMYAIMDAG